MMLLGFSSFAQVDAEKSLKTAGKAISSYFLDPAGNKGKLDEAKAEIEIAAKNDVTAANLKTWMTRGQIYNAIAANESGMLAVDKTFKLKELDAPYLAYESFNKAFNMAEKKYDKKDALKGMQESSAYLTNTGISKFEKKDFKGAYESVMALIKINDLFKQNAMDPVFAKDEDLDNTHYIAGLAATNAGMGKEATEEFEGLLKKGFAKSDMYESLYKIKSDAGDAAGALKVLEEGRVKFPDEVNLLFTEINHYLTANKLDVLVDKLKLAIQKEPNNVPLYITLGNVYDNLFQRESDSNSAKADEYFKNSLDYYNQAASKDPKSFDAAYSIGALYYNKAATVTKELNKLTDDYSKEGIKKYDALKAKMVGYFNDALPFFKKSEELNPNDRNTLIALKEVFAKVDQLELSSEFKKRLDNLDAGNKNTSYFAK